MSDRPLPENSPGESGSFLPSKDIFELLDRVLAAKKLSDIQELVLYQCLEGKSYQEIAEAASYDPNYVKDVGSKLWQLLSEVFGEKVTKTNLRSVLRRNLLHIQPIENKAEAVESNAQKPRNATTQDAPPPNPEPRTPNPEPRTDSPTPHTPHPTTHTLLPTTYHLPPIPSLPKSCVD